MKERPILFGAPMVRAILAGRKQQTRRVAKPVKHPDLGNIYTPGALVLEHEPRHVIERACPYGTPGDRLWVRETWRTYASLDDIPPRSIAPGAGVQYEAGGSNLIGVNRLHGTGKLRPGMFMPRWASRITLEITAVRVERLQDISNEDALAEGITLHPDHHGKPRDSLYGPVQTYRDLWESIDGQGSWGVNPWVWVVEFRAVTP